MVVACVGFGCAQVSTCYTEIIPVSKLGKKCSAVVLPVGAESLIPETSGKWIIHVPGNRVSKCHGYTA